MFRLVVSLMIMSSTVGPISALAKVGPSGSGGGGPEAANFTSSARLIADVLRKAPDLVAARFGVPGFIELYTQAIDSTDVVCATEAVLRSMREHKQKAYYDGLSTIHLDCQNYQALLRTGQDRYVVVFHEYMRKMQLESSDYRYSSKLSLFFIPVTEKRAIDAFCEGGSKDKFQLETYISQMLQEKSLDEDYATMLRDASVNNIRFPDASSRQLATYLGWNKQNQYQWAVEMICWEKSLGPGADFSDTSMNKESVLALQNASGAILGIDKPYTIPRGRAAITLQNGKIAKRIDNYQSYCTFAHDTDPLKNLTVKPHNVRSGPILAFQKTEATVRSPEGFHVNFSVVDDKTVSDIAVWMPEDVGTIERLRSALGTCGVKLNLVGLVPAK